MFTHSSRWPIDITIRRDIFRQLMMCSSGCLLRQELRALWHDNILLMMQ
ncbi:hypothetical protein RIEGSTA812A_PEG_334 [invertebrate metagenome]|uniref:Uncharacterized protein n=1 Tax=invertebrate metagenome TaxID=1711999 RepID=A0A484H664_9ZZZZ